MRRKRKRKRRRKMKMWQNSEEAIANNRLDFEEPLQTTNPFVQAQQDIVAALSPSSSILQRVQYLPECKMSA